LLAKECVGIVCAEGLESNRTASEMNPSLFESTTIPVLEQVIGFAQARHGVLAGNVANLDTPGYKTRDLSPDLFQQRLKEAVDSRKASTGLKSPGEISSNGYEDFREVKDTFQSILFHDDSDVGIEKQIVEISKNQSMHNLALTIMTSQFRLLQTAISERVV
jgi:flagellar basal-body rod protein FlgB